MIEIIKEFTGEYRWLSNFHLAAVEYEGLVYPSTEHAYQAAKTTDLELRKQFLKGTPGKAKRLGNKLDLREDWDNVKIQVMYDVCSYKFKNHNSLRDKLLNTRGKYLIEGNTWGDQFWGVCKGEGRNELGKILMKIRSEL